MLPRDETRLVCAVVKYLLAMDRTKRPIPKNHIVKNVLGGCGKDYHLIIDSVQRQLHDVFGYQLVLVEGNKYILVNDIDNHLPHLTFAETSSSLTLLFLVLTHIFMLGNLCKEEILWDFLRNLGIVTNDTYHHQYFGDVKQLVTVDFVNQRYLERVMAHDHNDPFQFDYKWGCRAENEITYRSVLNFVAHMYGLPLNNWGTHYQTVVAQESLD